jgi:hypothetical protein
MLWQVSQDRRLMSFGFRNSLIANIRLHELMDREETQFAQRLKPCELYQAHVPGRFPAFLRWDSATILVTSTYRRPILRGAISSDTKHLCQPLSKLTKEIRNNLGSCIEKLDCKPQMYCEGYIGRSIFSVYLPCV